MSESNDKITRRKDPRYVETSEDLSDWIQVRMVEQFGNSVEVNGVLVDLTPRAVKVGLPGDSEELKRLYFVGKKLLVTFRFKNLLATTAAATIARIDNIPNGAGLVLFFDFIRESDRSKISKICEAYQSRNKNNAADENLDNAG